MTDPGAETIVIGGFNNRDFGAHLFRTMNKFSTKSGVNVLARKGREEPSRAHEKISVRKLHSSVLFARHRMSCKKSLPRSSSKRLRRMLNDLCFRASYIGDQRLNRKRGAKSFDQIDNGQNWSSQHHEIATLNGVRRITDARVNRAALLCSLQYRRTIAADDPRRKVTLLERQPDRTSDQARSDNGDLSEWHWRFAIIANYKSGSTRSRVPPQGRSCGAGPSASQIAPDTTTARRRRAPCRAGDEPRSASHPRLRRPPQEPWEPLCRGVRCRAMGPPSSEDGTAYGRLELPKYPACFGCKFQTSGCRARKE